MLINILLVLAGVSLAVYSQAPQLLRRYRRFRRYNEICRIRKARHAKLTSAQMRGLVMQQMRAGEALEAGQAVMMDDIGTVRGMTYSGTQLQSNISTQVGYLRARRFGWNGEQGEYPED